MISIMKARNGSESNLKQTGYIFEPKLDGVRALCFINKTIKLISRNNIDITNRYGHFDFRKQIKAKTCILDGEVVAFDSNGNTSFSELSDNSDVYYVVFDILMKDSISLTNKTLIDRKKILEKTVIDKKNLQKIFFTSDGLALWDKIKEKKAEGVVAKEIDGLYYSGERSSTWLKIKLFNTIDCIIIGYKTGKRDISSLALGLYYQGKIKYIGNVGTGFSEQEVEFLYNKLSKIQIEPNFYNQNIRDITWVKPKYVCEVKYFEFTKYGILRHSIFVKYRFDKKPTECTFKEQDLKL